MKTARLILVTAVLLVLAMGVTGGSSAITNGQPDEGAHPYVGLLVFDVAEGQPGWRCSGSLIAPGVVLTAGHCTEGAVAARVWFEEDSYEVDDYPFGGGDAIEGTPYTNPDFCHYCYGPSNGLPAFSYRDVGVVVLDEPVQMDRYAQLPEAGLVDTLANKTDLTMVGYGVQEMLHEPGQGAPDWDNLRVRMTAPSKMVSGNFVHSAEYIRTSLNPGGDKGGTCFGDSGGADLLEDTDTVLAVNSYVTNYNCAGVGYSARVDIAEVLEWIQSFLD